MKRLKVDSPSLGSGYGNSQILNMSVQERVDDEAYFLYLKNVMKKALQNPLVLHKIIRNLDFLELKTSRQINKMWKAIASEVMLKRDYCGITMKYLEKKKVFHLYHHPKSSWLDSQESQQTIKFNREQTLSSLNEILINSVNFPCSNFSFLGGSLRNDDMQHFFSFFGENVKTLRLVSSLESDGIETKNLFIDLLVNKAPNIRDLIIGDFPYKNWEKEDELYLPSLKILDFDADDNEDILENEEDLTTYRNKTCLELLRGAPNLQEMRNFDVDMDLEVVSQSNKIHTIKRFRYTDTDDCDINIRQLESFGDSGPQLEVFEILIGQQFHTLVPRLEDRRRIALALTKILESSKDTLTEILLTGLVYIPQLIIPKLVNLKLLRISRYDGNQDQRPFPLSINLMETFPNVVEFCIWLLQCDKDEAWNYYFPPGAYIGDLPCVKVVSIHDYCSPFWMKQLQSICPHFTTLSILAYDRVHVMLPQIFQLCSHLTEIKIKINVLSPTFHNLDSTFTGFSEETCERLRLTDEMKREENWERLQISPSLRDMHGLRRLRIYIGEGEKEVWAVCTNTEIPISHVSALYSFNLMPRLKVTIGYNHNSSTTSKLQSAFEAIAPHVNITHFHG